MIIITKKIRRLWDFNAWSGGEDVIELAEKIGASLNLEEVVESFGESWDEQSLNDFLRFQALDELASVNDCEAEDLLALAEKGLSINDLHVYLEEKKGNKKPC